MTLTHEAGGRGGRGATVEATALEAAVAAASKLKPEEVAAVGGRRGSGGGRGGGVSLGEGKGEKHD